MSRSDHSPDASSRVPAEDSGALPYSDPTGNRVVELLTGQDVTVCLNGQEAFIMNSALLLDLIGRHVTFAPSRRGNSIRAHKKKASTDQGGGALADQSEGEVNPKGSENDR